MGDGIESSSYSLQPCRIFQFMEIQQATNNFDESLVIGHGGFGKAYKGNIVNGSDTVVAAIKRYDANSHQGTVEFWTEVEVLSKLRHNNLVSLIGYCDHENEMILVYEYIPNGTLHEHLHRLGTSLSWLQRLNICIGVACGLDYLHTGGGERNDIVVIHRDVKSSNILLQDSWDSKITDFGLSKVGRSNQSDVSTLIKGTLGYLDPDYFINGRLTRKSDVYSFGVVLLEVLCRRRAVDRTLDEEQWGLVRWAQEYIKKGNLKHIVDSDLRGQISRKCLKKFVRIVEGCLHEHSKQRPTMAEVVSGLEYVLTLQENINNSLQPATETIFSRMVDMLRFPSRMVVDRRPIPSNKQKPASSEHSYKEFEPPSSALQGSQPCHHFEFPEIQNATNDFDESLVIGHGSFGKVYKGNVINGSSLVVVAAIKRLDPMSGQGAVQFWAEVDILSMFRHWNLVSLIGYCHYEKEMILVYEYMPNGTLGDHLHKHGTPLSWIQRLKICIGAAHGLLYLHTGTGIVDGAIHHDVKSSNILLNESWAAKISDFGLAEIDSMDDNPSTYANTTVSGTFGYLDPACSFIGRLTKKSDVYAFGVVLLEVLCRRPALDRSLDEENPNLARWAQKSIKEGNLKRIIDSDIRDQISPKCLRKFVQIVERCLHENPKHRSTMAEVVEGLQSVLTLQEKFNSSLQPQNKIL